MSVALLRKMHPDLKLGLALIAAAALLRLGDPGGFLLTLASLQLDFTMSSRNLLVFAGRIGGLAVIAAAIWVDRRPPHTMMAAGALFALLGLSTLSMPASVEAYAVGLFVAGLGGSAVDPLIFYAIVAKGAARYRGMLIGGLGMVFLLCPGSYAIADWQIRESFLFILVSAAFALAGAALLFVALPRVFTGAYEPGQTPRTNPGAPGIWRALIWAIVAYSAAEAAALIVDINVYGLTTQWTSRLDASELEFPLAPTFHIASAVGILLWGAAGDFLALRRWLLLTAMLYMLGAGAAWVSGGLPASTVGLLAVGLARGGLICLPLILMAELLPTRHFAKLAILVTYVGGVTGAVLGGLLLTAFSEAVPLIFLALVVEALALSIIAVLMPRPRAAEEFRDDTKAQV